MDRWFLGVVLAFVFVFVFGLVFDIVVVLVCVFCIVWAIQGYLPVGISEENGRRCFVDFGISVGFVFKVEKENRRGGLAMLLKWYDAVVHVFGGRSTFISLGFF